ncbi:ABC transporter substrate-binding protein [Microlunatus sp. Gsoil 973]|uniref:ABC transporter substrate-binding protein n=1 Tax=Microlunatus sp. Gsoil 973 TaxID=2672569 RepID=UPI0018A7EF9D|nr:ABC transporter substrate-binding protein [Microlunatus sp. Gsoil 973]
MKWKVHDQRSGADAAGRRLRLLFAALCSVLLITAAACTGGSPGADNGGGNGGGGGGNISAKNANPQTTAFRWGTRAWAASIVNNPYSPTPTPDYNLSLLSLAVVSDWDRPGDNPYYPEIAESWDVGKHSITFHLRTDAKWQDDKPLTSKDVLTAFRVAGVDYNSVWAAITKVSAPDDHTVTVDLQSWAVPQNALLHLLQIVIVPDSQYGQFVPSDVDKTLISYWKTYNILHPTADSISKASDGADGKVMAENSANLVKYNPKPMIGNGPYKLKSANVSGILYEKWDGFWDAKKITAPYVQVYPMNTSTEYGALSSGSIELETDNQFSDPQAEALNRKGANTHYVFIPSPVQQVGLVVNFNHYPFNIREVRQALEYVIDRHDLVKRDMGGDLVQNPAEETPDGINYFEAKKYLTPDQFAKLNHYPKDTAKAASLLESVGFTKQNGKWMTPKGTPFAFTISEAAGIPYFDEDGLIIAGYLKNFGIDVKVENVDPGTYTTKQLAGDFAVSQWWMDWGQGPPMADFAAGFGQASSPSWNYPISYSGKGPCKCAIGIGPEADVPGLGHVNIASELNREVNQEPPETWAKYTWAWAQWFNKELPFLPLYNNAFHEAYSTSRYTNFPPDSEKWLWTGLTGAAQPVEWMQNGYLKLK